MRRALLIVFTLVIFGIVLALVLENLRPIEFDYLFGTVRLPLAAALAVALVIGAIIGALAMLPAALATKLRRRHLEKRLHAAEREIETLRRPPLRDAR